MDNTVCVCFRILNNESAYDNLRKSQAAYIQALAIFFILYLHQLNKRHATKDHTVAISAG